MNTRSKIKGEFKSGGFLMIDEKGSPLFEIQPNGQVFFKGILVEEEHTLIGPALMEVFNSSTDDKLTLAEIANIKDLDAAEEGILILLGTLRKGRKREKIQNCIAECTNHLLTMKST